MGTLLICLLLLYNAWLVAYILSGKQQRINSPTEDKPSIKPPQKTNEIVGRSLFKMEMRTPTTAIPTPQAATSAESEDVTDIAVTFTDGKDETPPARLPDDKLDEAFSDIRISDVPQEYADEEEDEAPTERYATGVSFEEIGEAVSIVDDPAATQQEQKRAGKIFSEMEGNDLFNKLTKSSPERAKKITGLMDSFSNKPISGKGQATAKLVSQKTITGVPADISEFDIRNFV